MALFNRKDDVIKDSVATTVDLQEYFTSAELNWKVYKICFSKDSFSCKEIPIVEYTYIIADSLNATYKIGRTTNNPEERLGNLRTANPSVSLKMVFPHQQYSEKELHDKYNAYRKDREWFFSTKEIVDFVEKSFIKNEMFVKLCKQLEELNKLQ